MDIIQVITKELNVEKWQVEAAVKLIDEGCTIPFISRYPNGSATRALTTGVEFVHIKDVAGSFVADDVVDKDPDDGDEPGGGGGEAPDPAA